MRKLITVEGMGDTRKLTKLLSNKLQAIYFFRKPPVNTLQELVPFDMAQMANAFTAIQFGKEDNYAIIDKGYRSTSIQAGSMVSDVAYNTFEKMLQVLGTNKVEYYHVFIIDPTKGHANQITQIQKCKERVNGGKYIIVSNPQGTLEDLANFIIEEVK